VQLWGISQHHRFHDITVTYINIPESWSSVEPLRILGNPKLRQHSNFKQCLDDYTTARVWQHPQNWRILLEQNFTARTPLLTAPYRVLEGLWVYLLPSEMAPCQSETLQHASQRVYLQGRNKGKGKVQGPPSVRQKYRPNYFLVITVLSTVPKNFEFRLELWCRQLLAVASGGWGPL